MAGETKRGASGWLIFMAGAILGLILAFGYMVWNSASVQTAQRDLRIDIPRLAPPPDLPVLPPPPDIPVKPKNE